MTIKNLFKHFNLIVLFQSHKGSIIKGLTKAPPTKRITQIKPKKLKPIEAGNRSRATSFSIASESASNFT